MLKKGVSVDQVARVTKAFSDAGILVHAYLMYGFPTQTVQDTVDALEYVRQLFANGCIQSGFFHRFACTVHSPVGKNPEEYGVTLAPLPPGDFAKNDVAFIDPTGVDHDALGAGLKKKKETEISALLALAGAALALLAAALSVWWYGRVM